MHDPRLDKLANVLTTHSTKIQPNEFVFIEGIDIPQEMVITLFPVLTLLNNFCRLLTYCEYPK